MNVKLSSYLIQSSCHSSTSFDNVSVTSFMTYEELLVYYCLLKLTSKFDRFTGRVITLTVTSSPLWHSNLSSIHQLRSPSSISEAFPPCGGQLTIRSITAFNPLLASPHLSYPLSSSSRSTLEGPNPPFFPCSSPSTCGRRQSQV